MNDPEKGKCLLCGQSAEKRPFNEGTGGRKYDCVDCGSYAIGEYGHGQIENFVKDRKDRLKLAEWVKDNPDPKGEYVELTWPRIKKILAHIFL